MIYIETIDLFSRIEGISRPPDIAEHLKVLQYDDILKMFKYIDITKVTLDLNTVALDGIVRKGSTGAPNYVWKLNANNEPAWRAEEPDLHLTSITKSTNNSANFRMSNGVDIPLSLGALAWKDTLDFTAGTDFQVIFNKDGKLDGSNKFMFDYISTQLKLTDFGGLMVKKSSIDSTFYKVLNYIGAGILELGDNVYIKEAIRIADYKGSQPTAGLIQYKDGKPQWHDGIIWHDFANNIDTYLTTVQQITVADTESDDYKLSFVLNDNTVFTIQLGANAFNGKFIPTVSGGLGYLQLSDGEGDLSSSANLTFFDNVLLINGVLNLDLKNKGSYSTSADGTILAGDDNHFYGINNNEFQRLDNIDYSSSNVGTGLGILKNIEVVDENNTKFNFKSLISGANITLTPTTDGIQIDATAGVASGEVNVGENIGTGVPIYRGKDGVAFKYHKLKGTNGINVTLANDTITIAGEDANGNPSVIANNYLKEINGIDNLHLVPSEFVHSLPYIVTNQYDTKSVEFKRNDLSSIIVEFGTNAFDSEPIRNLQAIHNKSNTVLNTGTIDSKYKLQFVFDNTDESNESILEYQLGKNAFTSYPIPSIINSNPKTWTLGTKELKYRVFYKADTDAIGTSSITTFQLKFGEGLTYNDITNVLDVSSITAKYITDISRVEDTTHIAFTFNDDSVIDLDTFGQLAFLDFIDDATVDTYGIVKLGGNVYVGESGSLWVDLPDDTDISRLVSYDEQGFSDGDRAQARSNISSAFVNGDIDEDFNVNILNVNSILNAPNAGTWSTSDYEEGFHKLSAVRIADNVVTSSWGNLRLIKGDSQVSIATNDLDFTVGDDGNISWYVYISGVKTRVMALLPRTDIDKGLVYDLHVQGEIVEFSNSL